MHSRVHAHAHSRRGVRDLRRVPSKSTIPPATPYRCPAAGGFESVVLQCYNTASVTAFCRDADMPFVKRICAIVVAISLFASGCSIPLGYTNVPISTVAERVPISTSGKIQSEVRTAPGGQAVVKLTRMQEEEVRTVQLSQGARREFDLTGLAIGLGFGIGIGFIILLIVGIETGGGGGGDDDD